MSVIAKRYERAQEKAQDPENQAFVTVVAAAVVAGGIAFLLSGQGSQVWWVAVAVVFSLIVGAFGLWSMREAEKDARARQQLDDRMRKTKDEFHDIQRAFRKLRQEHREK